MPNYNNGFFASANSGCGFINMFGEIFSGLEHLYIIKGGSGTGKSSFMRKAAKAAENKGYTVEYCFCSSDPESLDGILIKEISVGFIDGTSPHVADAKYPGAYDEIINMGEFWNSSVLKEHKDEIKTLTDRKSMIFKEVYSYLNAAYSLEKTADKYLLGAFDTEKAKKAAWRIVRSVASGECKGRDIRLCEGITMKGYIRLSVYPQARKIFSINDRYGTGHLFLSLIEELTKKAKATVSYQPLDTKKMNMLYLHDEDMLFEINSQSRDAQNINMDRFMIKEKVREFSNELRHAKKLSEILTQEAYSHLERIRDIHFDLERIYISAMDFEKKEEFENKLLIKIFG